ncbi:envelope integrity protein Cei [Actinokineospora enzanensis]|uniref:envelope integrity protein Cei n=1 Tax=Actinokineospora enzanensis TaxID=155975 RepID=UPI00037AD76F|nr:envelope integrity protein Cei [Actinokineospora enzanensis]
MATGNLRTRQQYRRRRPLPAIILMAVLGLVAAFVWIRVIDGDSTTATTQSCNPPVAVPAVEGKPAPAAPGQALPADALDRTVPAPAAEGLVRVVNASGQNRLAGLVTEELRALGYSQLGQPDTDSVYPNGTLTCRAQIRFGQAGMSTARTLSLVEPCAELVRDQRPDATVDLALGKKFDHVEPSSEARRILEDLADWAQANPGASGGLQTDGGAAPPVDEALVKAARDTRC